MSYGLHPSEELQRLFRSQGFPHQGQDPERAAIIIIGLDANYSPEISSRQPFFQRIIEYHSDGVGFWRRHGVHHPFLLPDYPLNKTTGGVPYHRRFGWMGLDPKLADQISFIELLDVPTTGRTDRSHFWDLFSIEHAGRIDSLVSSGSRRLVLLSNSLVSNYMEQARKRWGVFDWLPTDFRLGPLKAIGDTQLLGAPHFSATKYKKEVFHDLGDDIRKFCGESRDA
ncbi:MAG: hypothetical protein HKN13_02005 [Rhodothermales bacterium]|nr:hypothetical protein [Rhodothermales bacterium]